MNRAMVLGSMYKRNNTESTAYLNHQSIAIKKYLVFNIRSLTILGTLHRNQNT